MERKTNTNLLTEEKTLIRLLIGHTIFFTSEKNRVTNETAFHEKYTEIFYSSLVEGKKCAA